MVIIIIIIIIIIIQDHILSKAEILNQQDLFVGSQATEHGKLFVRHDEF